MIMKKFYILFFSAVFLLASFSSHAQVYNSISDGNPNGYTFDDPRFWVGGVAPPSPCTSCTIKISSTCYHGSVCRTSTDKSIAPTIFTAQVPTVTLLMMVRCARVTWNEIPVFQQMEV